MILFYEIVEIVVGLVENIIAKRFADGAWVGAMSVRRNELWGMANCLECLLKKALGRIHIALLAEHGINQVPITINGTIQVTPFSLHARPYVRINMPAGSSLSISLSPKLIRNLWGKTSFPVSNGFMRKHPTTL